MTDFADVRRFMAAHARLLDRRRLELITPSAGPSAGPGAGAEPVAAALSALGAYRNADGGYGSGLEPDLRSSSSQPVSALHAFEVFEEIAPLTAPEAAALCDWLGSIALPDGGLPFGLAVPDPAGSAPYFLDADPTESSLHMTCMLAAMGHRIGRHDHAVQQHAWLATATDYSMRRIRSMDEPGHALEYRFALQFLDAVHDVEPRAGIQLRRLGGFLPASGSLAVGGGAEGEALRPLDFAPEPGRPIRGLFRDVVVEAELDRLAAGQRDDGGWAVDWNTYSPAAAVEWRGWATVRAVRILHANGRS